MESETVIPLIPIQVIVYIVVIIGAIVSVPPVALLPLQPFVAVQEVTFWEVHDKTAVCPLYIVDG